MKVVALQGSPRRGGNTEIILEAVIEGVKANAPGAEVNVIRAADLNVSGCIEDFACQAVLDSPGCSIEDDMGDIYMALLRADLIILASPVFCWAVTAQLKAVLDRLYATFKFSEDPPRSLLAGKPTALVVTAGGSAEDGADLVTAMYERIVRLSRSLDKGRLVCPFMKGPDSTRDDRDLLKRARRFGASLV